MISIEVFQRGSTHGQTNMEFDPSPSLYYLNGNRVLLTLKRLWRRSMR